MQNNACGRNHMGACKVGGVAYAEVREIFMEKRRPLEFVLYCWVRSKVGVLLLSAHAPAVKFITSSVMVSIFHACPLLSVAAL